LFHAQYRAVLAFAARRIDAATAEDVASEVMSVAWRRLDDVPAGPDARWWLFACTHRLLANRIRSAQRQHALVTKIRTMRSDRIADAPDLGSPFDDDRVQAAIDALKPEDREALTLVAADCLTHREAALILDIRENTFTVRFQRARRRFREELHKQGITSATLETTAHANGGAS